LPDIPRPLKTFSRKLKPKEMECTTMKTVNEFVRNASGPSPYFQGRYKRYGQYQWNVKLHQIDFDDHELESIRDWALGERVKVGRGYGFERINELLGHEVESYLEGQSGGWLTINADLTPEEIQKIDSFVSESLKGIPLFLKEEREYRAEEQRRAEEEEKSLRALQNDKRIQKALALIEEVAGADAVMIVKGIRLK
jgi:hypothetical protein